MIWISAEDVILIHSRVIEGSGGLDGLRDRDGLEAAVSAPMQTFDGKELYPKKAAKKCQTKDEFAKNLRSELMYYFWSKCEWEVLLKAYLGIENAPAEAGAKMELHHRVFQKVFNIAAKHT